MTNTELQKFPRESEVVPNHCLTDLFHQTETGDAEVPLLEPDLTMGKYQITTLAGPRDGQ